MPDRPLLVTPDPDLLDDLLRLCAAAGAEARVAVDVPAARLAWAEAPLVVLDDALSGQVLASGLSRRGETVVVGRDLDDGAVWTRASTLGAQAVVCLPGGEPLLVARIGAACAAPPGRTTAVAVVGGRGGVGASTLACGLAVTAAAAGRRTVLVDADRLGGGLDLVLGCEDLPGLRWPDLRAAGGTVSASALRTALPRLGALHLLSWDRGDPAPIEAGTARAVLAAARQAAEVLVVDLPRHLDEAATAALAVTDRVLLVVPGEVRAVAAARRVAAGVGRLVADVRVVARGPAPSGLTASQVAGSLGRPLAGSLRSEPGLARGLERGQPPARSGRGPMAALCRSLLEDGPRARRSAA